jgi:hypothetical protein
MARNNVPSLTDPAIAERIRRGDVDDLLVRIEGWVESAREGRIRIYLNSERTWHVELPENAILYDVESSGDNEESYKKYAIVRAEKDQSTGGEGSAGAVVCITTTMSISYVCGSNEDGTDMWCDGTTTTERCREGEIYLPPGSDEGWADIGPL